MDSSEREEKQEIMRRLRAYREKHGLGCFSVVAKATKTKGRINDNTLRMIMMGDGKPLLIDTWRKIGKALDRLEETAMREERHGTTD